MLIARLSSKPVYAIAFSPDGRWLAAQTGGGTTFLLSVPSFAKHHVWETEETIFEGSLSFSGDSRYLACGGYGGVHVWAIDSPADPVLKLATQDGQLAFRPGSSEIFVHSRNAGTRRWAIPFGERLPGGWGGAHEGRTGPSKGIAFHPDGTRYAAAFGKRGENSDEAWIELWTTGSGRRLARIEPQPHAVRFEAMRFSPDGSTFAAVHSAKLRVLNGTWEQELATREVGTKHFKGLAYSADGQRIVTVSNDQSVRVWRAPSWEQATTYDWRIGKLTCIDASADGCLFAAGSGSGKLVIWDAM